MTEQHLLEEVFRGLAPINQLAPAAQQRLWATATQRTLSAGQLVFARATDDGLLHFVLDGSVDLIDQGRFVQRLNPTLPSHVARSKDRDLSATPRARIRRVPSLRSRGLNWRAHSIQVVYRLRSMNSLAAPCPRTRLAIG